MAENTVGILQPGNYFEDGLIVRFYMQGMKNDFKSRKAKEAAETLQKESKGNGIWAPVFDNVEMCEIKIPGDNKVLQVERLSDGHRERFPKSYAEWKSGRGGSDGFPLENWEPAQAGTVEALKACHVYTVEQLATVQDGLMDSLPREAHALRDKAKAFVTANSVANQNAELTKILSTQNERIAMLERLLTKSQEVEAKSAEIEAEEREDAVADEVERPKSVERKPMPKKLTLPPHMQPPAA